MKISSAAEMARQFDSIARGLKAVPYPTPEAVTNTYEIAVTQFPGAKGLNPLSLWDLHWIKMLDDQGFIEDLIKTLSR